MFLTFQKITTATPSKKSTILVSSESILLLEVDSFENRELGTSYNATRVELTGYPSYKFHTLTSLSSAISYLRAIDLTAGFSSSGSECAGTPGVLDLVQPSLHYPLIKASAIFNSSPGELREYVFNPNFIAYAEEVRYGGLGNSQYTGLMLSLRDSRNVLTSMSLADLTSLLEPVEVPSP